MEKNVVILDVNEYNRLIAKATRCQELEEKQEKLMLEIADLKHGKVQLEQKVSSDKGESIITQRPKCTTIKVKHPDGELNFLQRPTSEITECDTITADMLNVSDDLVKKPLDNLTFISGIKAASADGVLTLDAAKVADSIIPKLQSDITILNAEVSQLKKRLSNK